MPKTFVRIVALGLVTCLVADPVTASVFANNSLCPSASVVNYLAQTPPFETETLMLRLAVIAPVGRAAAHFLHPAFSRVARLLGARSLRARRRAAASRYLADFLRRPNSSQDLTNSNSPNDKREVDEFYTAEFRPLLKTKYRIEMDDETWEVFVELCEHIIRELFVRQFNEKIQPVFGSYRALNDALRRVLEEIAPTASQPGISENGYRNTSSHASQPDRPVEKGFPFNKTARFLIGPIFFALGFSILGWALFASTLSPSLVVIGSAVVVLGLVLIVKSYYRNKFAGFTHSLLIPAVLVAVVGTLALGRLIFFGAAPDPDTVAAIAPVYIGVVIYFLILLFISAIHPDPSAGQPGKGRRNPEGGISLIELIFGLCGLSIEFFGGYNLWHLANLTLGTGMPWIALMLAGFMLSALPMIFAHLQFALEQRRMARESHPDNPPADEETHIYITDTSREPGASEKQVPQDLPLGPEAALAKSAYQKAFKQWQPFTKDSELNSQTPEFLQRKQKAREELDQASQAWKTVVNRGTGKPTAGPRGKGKTQETGIEWVHAAPYVLGGASIISGIPIAVGISALGRSLLILAGLAAIAVTLALTRRTRQRNQSEIFRARLLKGTGISMIVLGAVTLVGGAIQGTLSLLVAAVAVLAILGGIGFLKMDHYDEHLHSINQSLAPRDSTAEFPKFQPVDEQVRQFISDILKLGDLTTAHERLNQLLRQFNHQLNTSQRIVIIQSFMWISDWPEFANFILFVFTGNDEVAQAFKTAFLQAMEDDRSGACLLALQEIFRQLPPGQARERLDDIVTAVPSSIYMEAQVQSMAAEAVIESQTTDIVEQGHPIGLEQQAYRAAYLAKFYENVASIHRRSNNPVISALSSKEMSLASLEHAKAGELYGQLGISEGPSLESAEYLRIHSHKTGISMFHIIERDILDLKGSLKLQLERNPLAYYWDAKWLIRLEALYIEYLEIRSDPDADYWKRKLQEHQQERRNLKIKWQKTLGLLPPEFSEPNPRAKGFNLVELGQVLGSITSLVLGGLLLSKLTTITLAAVVPGMGWMVAGVTILSVVMPRRSPFGLRGMNAAA